MESYDNFNKNTIVISTEHYVYNKALNFLIHLQILPLDMAFFFIKQKVKVQIVIKMVVATSSRSF